ncbi:DUF6338 family protein (plasmid) [Mesorhizobium mediterraneum]|uniref:DUF5673 domain-containing protein n=1 Tax=Mesorhizobium mediterraneum TaxID=43617 RepID=A0AB36RFQ0_9HYPH|nr:DUF6338 family protein [Mesorhizobium mediterraneum]PAQ03769.1 hypothetical protein CIT25_02930 [Mesorhizobium mediterraneum]WIW57342.1 DUF6338 family protein [Mesorhizobium mediterraneum]
MGNFLSLDAIYVALVFVVPGYIISSFRAHFITGQRLDGHDYFVRLLTLSALNFTLSGWTIYLAIAWNAEPVTRMLLWLLVLAVSPALIGFVSGLGSKAEWLRKVYGWLKLSPLHIIPTSWEYQFSTLSEAWVYVVLKDSTTFAGYWGGKSFASSRPEERDLLIEQVFEVPNDGPWTPTNKSVLIGSGEIRTVEFTPVERNKG